MLSSLPRVEMDLCNMMLSVSQDGWVTGAHCCQTLLALVILVLSAVVLGNGSISQAVMHVNIKVRN